MTDQRRPGKYLDELCERAGRMVSEAQLGLTTARLSASTAPSPTSSLTTSGSDPSSSSASASTGWVHDYNCHRHLTAVGGPTPVSAASPRVDKVVAMVIGQSSARALAQVSLASGRILGSARSIIEAHRFGVPEGDHEHPWTAAYMREAVSVYAAALPVWYQRAIVSLYRQCVETMGVVSIPGALAEDWLIVRQHLANASHAIEPHLAAQPEPAPSQRAALSEISDHEPVVVRVDRLAALTTSAGARRLEQAALAVQGEVGSGAAIRLDEEQMRLLRAVASGAAIVDLAIELGYSQRTLFRELAALWKALGVPDRVQGIRKATSEGLLD